MVEVTIDNSIQNYGGTVWIPSTEVETTKASGVFKGIKLASIEAAADGSGAWGFFRPDEQAAATEVPEDDPPC